MIGRESGVTDRSPGYKQDDTLADQRGRSYKVKAEMRFAWRSPRNQRLPTRLPQDWKRFDQMDVIYGTKRRVKGGGVALTHHQPRQRLPEEEVTLLFPVCRRRAG